jgi:NAD(P)H dehydrogenase (quinone)
VAFGPEGKATYATIADLAEANVILLLQSGHESKTYTLDAGEELSLRQVTGLLSQIYEKPIPYQSITREAYVAALTSIGIPAARANFGADFIEAIALGEFSGPSDALEKLIGRKPKTMRQDLADDLASQDARHLEAFEKAKTNPTSRETA